jgi:hypothetical protein
MPIRIAPPPSSQPVSKPAKSDPTPAEKLARDLSWNLPTGSGSADLTVTEFRDGGGSSRARVDLGTAATGQASASGVRNGGGDVQLPTPIVLRGDAGLERYTACASIPLDTIDTSPLAKDEFAALVKGAVLLPPWGKDGTAGQISVRDGRLELEAPVGAPGAFIVSPPIVFVQLSNGQNVSLRLLNNQVGRDDAALLRAQAERSIESVQTVLSYDAQYVAEATAALGGAPTSPRLEEALANQQAHQAELARAQEQLESVKAGTGTVEYTATRFP